MKRILFIGHEAGRSGAPMVLLYFLEWLRENKPDYQIDLLLLRGGDLTDDFARAADVFVFPHADNFSVWRRGLGLLKKRFNWLPRLPRLAPFAREYDLVVGNTLISLELLEHFKQKKFPTICWLHELDYAVRLYSEEKFARLAQFVDRFVVPSKPSEQMLRRLDYKGAVHHVYEFIKPVKTNENKEAVRKEMGIPADAFVIGGAGTVEWRKGVDWFLQLAARLPEFYFVWVGGGSPYSDVEYKQIRHDFERLDISENMIFTGASKDFRRIFAAFDLFALTSREDPFPLVCLEAAQLARPVLCFAGTGGIPEFVEADAGAVAPYGDLEAFAANIRHFHEHPAALRRAGEKAFEKVETRFSLEESCAAFEKILEECAQ